MRRREFIASLGAVAGAQQHQAIRHIFFSPYPQPISTAFLPRVEAVDRRQYVTRITLNTPSAEAEWNPRGGSRRLVLEPVVLRKATCGPSEAACIKPYKVVGQHATASWWDSSIWLAAVLPSGRKLGLRFPAALALY